MCFCFFVIIISWEPVCFQVLPHIFRRKTDNPYMDSEVDIKSLFMCLCCMSLIDSSVIEVERGFEIISGRDSDLCLQDY